MREELGRWFVRTGTLHHAYGIAGPWDATVSDIEMFLQEELGLKTTGNPDVQSFFCETFGIDESRRLEGAASRRALQPQGKFFIVGGQALTHEAQNALLKLLEDPSPDTVVFLVVPSHSILLPTLRSRLYLIERPDEDVAGNASVVQVFLRAGPRERLEFVGGMIEEKDRSGAVNFVNGLEEGVYRLPQGTVRSDALRTIAVVRPYVTDSSSSLKLLLEHLSLALPSF